MKNNTTNITNITYANRNVQGAVTAVPQRAFAGAQPVAKAAVAVDSEQLRAAPVSARGTLAPPRQAVLGAKASIANRVTAPPPPGADRQAIDDAAPAPPPSPLSA